MPEPIAQSRLGFEEAAEMEAAVRELVRVGWLAMAFIGGIAASRRVPYATLKPWPELKAALAAFDKMQEA